MNKFRIIPIETHTAAKNMALDEACMEAIRAGEAPPTIRIYRWKPSAVTIGYFQCLTDEIDVAACKQDGVAIVRRQTGGGAVYHDSEGEITYSVIAPEERFAKDIIESYKQIIAPVLEALKEHGITTEFRPINDITTNGRKLSGNAQTRKGGVLQQHGTILYSVDPDKMFSYLTPDKSKISDKPFVKSIKSAVTSVSEEADITREELEKTLMETFTKAFDATPGVWTESEQDRASELMHHKYGDESWNAMR